MAVHAGGLLVSGVQLGNVWIGTQPALGVEGDPMRLLFERDFTPHPQYAAFYQWLAQDWGAHALLHFGMHGTAEWLPGAPLGMRPALGQICEGVCQAWPVDSSFNMAYCRAIIGPTGLRSSEEAVTQLLL